MIRKALSWLGLSLALAIPALAGSGGFDLEFYNSPAWVSQRQFTDPTTVYLGGSGLTDGQYYFQITNASGGTVLSQDDISCRIIVVSGGVVTGVPGTAGACTTGFHVVSGTSYAPGGFPVQMAPFSASSNGVYKAYITPVTGYSGFQPNNSSKITFKINCAPNCGNSPPPPQTMIGGTKYFDENSGNTTDSTKPLAGILDTVHDPLLSNWTINIYSGTDTTAAPLDMETTDMNGAWSTFVDQDSEITVCEVLTTGWTQSGPSPTLYSTMPYSTYTPPGNVVADHSSTDGGGNCWQMTSVGSTAITGLDFGNYLQITGKKQYNLTSADSGTGIPNWPITIACDSTATTAGYCQNASVVTDVNGNYLYKPTGPITSYLVCEGTETTWTQSYPTGSTPAVNGATVDTAHCASSTVGWAGAVGTASGSGLDFSNYATINGTKFYSGASTPTGLSGWTISLGATTTTTGANGKYSINVPSYPFAATNVCETSQTGWTEITPSPTSNNGCYSYALPGLTPTVTPTASTLDFSNNIQISGAKYYDPTGSGTGTGVSGVTINIAYTPVSGSPTSTTTTTGALGAYSFTFPVPVSTYTVTETVPTGWTQSYPPAGSYTGTPGTSPGTGLIFGNYVKVSGTKYYGTTATTLNGWTINLNNSVPATVATTTTAGAGAYSLTIPSYPFTGNICEVAQSGWTELSPTSNGGCYPISLSGLTVTAGPFNFQNVIVLSGLKFYDLNLDQMQDNAEAGIGGFKIAIYSCTGTGCTLGATPAYTYTTALSGAFTWTAPAPGITNFKVCEMLPPTGNWTETTTPACYTGTVGTSPQTNLTFGNVCAGNGATPYSQGFWHNKNGTAILTSSVNYPGWANAINAFNNNTDTGWTGYLSFAPTTTHNYGMKLFTGTNATNDDTEIASSLFTTTSGANSANMLSTQLATMELNTIISFPGLISGNSAPNVPSASLMKVGTAAQLTANGCSGFTVNSAGYATILSVEQYANSLLLLSPYPSGNLRSCQAFIQTALDNANNNMGLTIIQPTACTVPTY